LPVNSVQTSLSVSLSVSFSAMSQRRRICASIFDAPEFKRARIFPPDGARPRGTVQSASGRVDAEEEEKLPCSWHPCSFFAKDHAQLQEHEWRCPRNWTQKLNPRSEEAKEESRQLALATALSKEIAQPSESAETAKLREQLASIQATVRTLSADLNAAGEEQIQAPGTSEKGAQSKAPAAKRATVQTGQEASRQQPIRAGKGPSPREERMLNAQRGEHPTWTVDEFAKIVGMRVEDVLGDGNCLFLAWMRGMGFIMQEEARPHDGKLTSEVANKVLQLRGAALAHVDKHFLAAEEPEAGPYGRIIADCSYNLDMSGELTLEKLKTQVRTGMAQLADLGAWRLERNGYIFNFIVCALACLGETPILCVESHARDNEVLHKHFRVYGDPRDPALKAFSHLAACEQPCLRDFDFTNGRCDDGAELKRVDVSGLLVLYNRNSVHYQCLVPPADAENPAGDGSAMGAPNRSVNAVKATPPPVLRLQISSGASRSCEVGPMGAASRSNTAASVPATNPEPRQTGSATRNCKSGNSTEVQRLEWVKRFAERLLPEVDLQNVEIRRFGPSVCACMQHLYDGDAAAATWTRPKR
jgi:hypothetical protein